jgi:peptidoglycan LD-endopeptidase LytH
MKKQIWMWLMGTGVMFFMFQCNSIKKIENVFKSQTPYEKYAESLKSSGLDASLLGRNWLSASTKAFKDSLFVNLPYFETGYFTAENPNAHVFNFLAREGTVLQVELDFAGDTSTSIFMDLYWRKDDWTYDHVKSADTNSSILGHEIKKTGIYSLRIQPELLAKGFFNLTLKTSAVYAFPVVGKTHLAIGSVFGDPRDGGRRRHEGVDIFAKKGTPVIAVADGRITRVQDRGLGGKVVWQWDNQRNINIYYAHLDSQLVVPGQSVNIGDIVGLVGNTGNAIRTPPHLHFGIYKRGMGAQDPYPFLYQPEFLPYDISERKPSLHTWKIITAQAANIRVSPIGNSKIIGQAVKDTPVFITGATKDWYRLILPDHRTGYIHQSLIREISNPITNLAVINKKAVLENINHETSLIGFIEPDEKIPVLGKFLDYYLISFNGILGWVSGT